MLKRSESFKAEIWFDVLVLAALWIVVFVVPDNHLEYQNISLLSILKIVALIGTLEASAFFTQLFLGVKAGTLIQGLAGGFISSTMTFVILTQDVKAISLPPLTVSRALLLATVGMLTECLIIIYAIVPDQASFLAKPLIIQIILIILFVVATGFRKKTSKDKKIEGIVLEEPIVWKKVGVFAVIILGLILLMRIFNTTLALPTIWSSFILSLFEAHGVLTAALSELQNTDPNQMLKVVLVIQLANVISKSFLVIKGKNKNIRLPVIFVLAVSLLVAWLSTAYL